MIFETREDGEGEYLAETSAAARAKKKQRSLTYRAGGSTRKRTVDLAKRIQSEIGLTVMSHITCGGSTREELVAIFRDLRQAGVENVLALRGDAPKDGSAPTGKLHYATDLVGSLRDEFDFSVGGACYAEVHPEAADAATDLVHLAAKVARGADHGADRAGHHADYRLSPNRPIHRNVRCNDSRLTSRSTRGSHRRAGSGCGTRCRLRHAAVRRFTRARSAGYPFLNTEQSLATRAVVSAIAGAGRWGRALATS